MENKSYDTQQMSDDSVFTFISMLFYANRVIHNDAFLYLNFRQIAFSSKRNLSKIETQKEEYNQKY